MNFAEFFFVCALRRIVSRTDYFKMEKLGTSVRFLKCVLVWGDSHKFSPFLDLDQPLTLSHPKYITNVKEIHIHALQTQF